MTTEPIPIRTRTPTGLLGMLDGFLGSTGTGMSKISFSQAGQVRSFIALCALAALFALSTAAVAQAEPPKLVPYGLFSAHEPAAVGVAVEGSGDLFVSGFVSLSGSSAFSPESVVKFDPSGKLLSPPSPFGSGYYSGVAVSPTNGDVYVLGQEGFSPPAKIFVYDPKDPCGEKHSPCLHLIEYSLEGRQLADVGAGEFGEASGGNEGRFFSMVTVNEASGRVYVTDGLRETVWMFGPPLAPVVNRELTAEVGASEAKLGALVSPGAIQTSYRFEYGTTTEYGSSTPFPEGSVGEGVQSRAVWASANGLAPGTTYHYRVVASNELASGGVAGPDQTFTTPSAEQVACPNEQMRGGFSQKLPDCRAYELVTPPVKSSSQFDAVLRMVYASKAAADGEALTLTIQEPRPGAPTGGEAYVARRGAGGWIAEDIMPLESYDGVACANYQFPYAFSEQLTKDVIRAGGASRATSSENVHEDPESCNPEGRQVVSGEPVGYENLLVRENATGAYQLVNVLPPGVTPADAHFQGASADVSHVVFTETSPLAQGASYGVENLYEWDEDWRIRLVHEPERDRDRRIDR